jgi:cyclohexa-1,5-dienecarbonyl-CoA hydratase
MTPAFESIRLDIAQGVATITLARPPLNILTLMSMHELGAALDEVVGHGPLSALVLRAEGRAFCAGVDVAEHVPGRVDAMIRAFGDLFTRLRGFPAPTVAVVHGPALGGGTELALGCDLVLAARSARFGQPEVKLGAFPPIAAALLPVLIGYQRAARLVLTGETVAAEEAVWLGLATFLAEDEELPSRLDQLLGQLRALSPAVLGLAKRALLLGADRGVAGALAPIEDLYLTALMATPDAAEGLRAFAEKRAPVWSGR